jgi:gamma-D-glutamyl-L-lysine dipeptidyl-peptidase
VRNNLPILNVYEKKTRNSKIVTQLLYGETFKKLTKFGKWIKIKNDLDNYKGFVKNRKFPPNHKNTHKVSVLSSYLYSEPKNKNKIRKKLGFASKIKIFEKKGNFYKMEKFWIKKNNVKKINYKNKDIFLNIKKFINIKYKWGGKHFSGIDCSGLVQLFFNYNNKYCPRDTKDQIIYFKKKVPLNKVKKNDLIFWRGHVALVLSKNKLIHAYGPLKKVVIMPIDKTIDRIYKTANLIVTGIRRP